MPARLKVLSELTHALVEATSNPELLHEAIVHQLTDAIGDACGLLLLSDDQKQLDFVAMHARDPELLRQSRSVLAERPLLIEENPRLAAVLHTGAPMLTPRVAPELEPHDYTPEYNRVSAAFHVHSRLTVALRLRGTPIGLLNLTRFLPDSPPFDERDLEMVQIIADSTALSITYARSYSAERCARVAAEDVERSLRDYQERLQRMAFDAAVAEERERHRLAVLLHDGIGQDLTLVQLKLSTLREGLRGAALQTLDQALDLLTRSAADRSTLTFELSPPVLYDLGLGAALSWLAEDLATRCGLHVTFREEQGLPALDETVAATVFRVARELLFNVRKHARSDHAALHLQRSGEDLEVMVEDGGVGFEAAELGVGALGRGFGLMSVREQIGRVGGELVLHSRAGHGTTARVRVPLAAATSNAQSTADLGSPARARASRAPP